jgi:hypothetical protein
MRDATLWPLEFLWVNKVSTSYRASITGGPQGLFDTM